MRIVFAATGDIALPSFRSVLGGPHPPVALITQPDKPVGRHQLLKAPLLKTEAIKAGIPVYQPERIGDMAGEVAALHADVMVVMAYGQILKENILSLPGTTIINLHASLLPKYRGAACIQAAIDAGDCETGITAMHVVRALDAGDIIHSRSLPIAQQETGGSLHDKLAQLAAETLAKTLDLLRAGAAPRQPQSEAEASYVAKLSREDGKIDWSHPACAIERRIRAYDPWPGTFTHAHQQGQWPRLKIFPQTTAITADLAPGQIQAHGDAILVGCGHQSGLLVHTVQPEAGKRMSAMAYLRGHAPERLD
jgi:methionyl-tRNA formyltransferase